MRQWDGLRCLLVAAAIATAASAPPQTGSRGSSSSSIIFGQSHISPQRPVHRRPSSGSGSGGGTIQFGETSAVSEQHSSCGQQTNRGSGLQQTNRGSGLQQTNRGSGPRQTTRGCGGQQTNRGQASGVSFQQQSGLGGATQTTNNQALVEALQQSAGGGGQQSSNNQVNIQSSQLQQNVEGTLVNVEAGNQGVVIVNTQDNTGKITDQRVVNGRPVGAATSDSSRCRYTCKHGITGRLYCCDDGSNRRGTEVIHGGQCPPKRLLCPHNSSFARCAHDGQCAASDKCCFDTCANRHVCKSADHVL